MSVKTVRAPRSEPPPRFRRAAVGFEVERVQRQETTRWSPHRARLSRRESHRELPDGRPKLRSFPLSATASGFDFGTGGDGRGPDRRRQRLRIGPKSAPETVARSPVARSRRIPSSGAVPNSADAIAAQGILRRCRCAFPGGRRCPWLGCGARSGPQVTPFASAPSFRRDPAGCVKSRFHGPGGSFRGMRSMAHLRVVEGTGIVLGFLTLGTDHAPSMIWCQWRDSKLSVKNNESTSYGISLKRCNGAHNGPRLRHCDERRLRWNVEKGRVR